MTNVVVEYISWKTRDWWRDHHSGWHILRRVDLFTKETACGYTISDRRKTTIVESKPTTWLCNSCKRLSSDEYTMSLARQARIRRSGC